MWTLSSQTINKEYYAGLMSRAFLLSAGCCLFAFVVPVLVLVSIGYSWNKYAMVSVQPQLAYENHQIACLLTDSTTIYASSFTDELTAGSYKAFLAVGGEANNYAISANIMTSAVAACSILVYFRVTLANLQSLAVLPIDFSTPSSAATASSLTQTGIIYAKSLSPLPQSSVQQADFTSYFYNDTQVLSMSDVHRAYASKKNVTLIPRTTSSQPAFSSSAGFSYLGSFSVPAVQVLQEVSMLANLRTFVPFFIYLFVLTWVFVAQPTVRWMLEHKIYQSKTIHPKIKYH